MISLEAVVEIDDRKVSMMIRRIRLAFHSEARQLHFDGNIIVTDVAIINAPAAVTHSKNKILKAFIYLNSISNITNRCRIIFNDFY